MPRFFPLLCAFALLFAACARPAASSTGAPSDALSADTDPAAAAATETQADLSPIKGYLLDQTGALQEATAALNAEAERYYTLAERYEFDYERLWQTEAAAVVETLQAAQTAWVQASPAYEKMEGIVAGTSTLATYDLILDAGASGAEDPQNAAPVDLTLPDGRILERPGNLFGVTESTLWGTEPDYAVAGVAADWDGSGTVDFGETLPDAGVLKAGAAALAHYADELRAAAQAWTPTPSGAFTMLVVMTPTMSEYFASWRDSRFIAGESSTQRDFVAISRLADIQDILGGLELVYAQLRPLVETANPDQAARIATGLANLKRFVAGVYADEQAGKRFTPENADLLGVEAQNRATAITGEISQIAAELGIAVAE
ncbi:MAG: EfeM/EfeO family lipoprotein [Caldilineaceae bacterium]|nr:EfeM/EfeO family lipoprotein [Caldilineaceae bacterium]